MTDIPAAAEGQWTCNFHRPACVTHAQCHEVTYADGESSGYADWIMALEVDSIEQAIKERDELRAALEAAEEKFQRIQNVALPSTMVMARAVDGENEAREALDALASSRISTPTQEDGNDCSSEQEE